MKKMTSPEEPIPSLHVQEQLNAAQSQLAMYARDLKRLLAREEQTSRHLRAANQQLQAYARDVKTAFDHEQQKSQALEKAYTDTIVRLTLASRYKDEETGAHLDRLSHYAKALALFIGLSHDEAELICSAAPMHDVGKIGVPDAILGKKGPLNQQEWETMQQHPTFGASLLAGSTSRLLEMAKDIALTHHERWDGSGYPQWLKGTHIPLAGRIVMLADHYDALRSPRPYKPAFPHPKACDIILHGNERTKPSHFDPQLLEAFRELHTEFESIYTRITDDETLKGWDDGISVSGKT